MLMGCSLKFLIILCQKGEKSICVPSWNADTLAEHVIGNLLASPADLRTILKDEKEDDSKKWNRNLAEHAFVHLITNRYTIRNFSSCLIPNYVNNFPMLDKQQ